MHTFSKNLINSVRRFTISVLNANSNYMRLEEIEHFIQRGKNECYGLRKQVVYLIMVGNGNNTIISKL